MKNYSKNLKYKELSEKLKSALENKFYYEAIFIEYAILEDRTKSILKYADISLQDKEGKELNLNSKLNQIKNNQKFKNEYVKRHITPELIQKTHEWKNQRNKIIHDLVNTDYNNNDIENLALEGAKIIKIYNNKSTLINKHNKKEQISV